MRRAIVHIGMPRTGSTSFPEVLTRLRPDLDGVGICYPRLAPAGSHASAAVNHHPLGQSRDGRRTETPDRASLNRLARVLAETEADVVVIAYEDFAAPRPDPGIPALLADLFRRSGFAMEVVLVVKPQAEQLASAYALRTQVLAEARTFRGFVRREGYSDRYDHGARLDPWRRAADERFRVVPVRDRRSPAPLLERLVAELGLADRLGPLLAPDALRDPTHRGSGPFAVEASRRLHALGLHRRVVGQRRRLGHRLDGLARARGLDAETFRGEARDAIAAVEAYHGEANERLGALAWGRSWASVVARAPAARPNELAGRPLPAEAEAAVEALVAEVVAHAGYHAPPAWLRRVDAIVEDGIERLADLIGRPTWRARRPRPSAWP